MKIVIFGDDRGEATVALVAVTAWNASQAKKLADVTSPIMTEYDPSTEHQNIQFKREALDQASFKMIDPKNKPMAIVSRRGVGPSNDA